MNGMITMWWAERRWWIIRWDCLTSKWFSKGIHFHIQSLHWSQRYVKIILVGDNVFHLWREAWSAPQFRDGGDCIYMFVGSFDVTWSNIDSWDGRLTINTNFDRDMWGRILSWCSTIRAKTMEKWCNSYLATDFTSESRLQVTWAWSYTSSFNPFLMIWSSDNPTKRTNWMRCKEGSITNCNSWTI